MPFSSLSVNDIILAAIASSNQVASPPSHVPPRPRPSFGLQSSLQQHKLTVRSTKRRTKAGNVVPVNQVLKEPEPFAGALRGFRACNCEKRLCDIKTGCLGDGFWANAIALFHAADDGDTWLRNWIVAGSYQHSMCKIGMAVMLRIHRRVVERCWPTPVTHKPKWMEADMPQECCKKKACLRTMGLSSARKMRRNFESQTSAGKALAASQMTKPSPITRQRPYKYCMVAMKALTGLGSDTLNSIARGKQHQPVQRRGDATKVRELPKEIKDDIIRHTLKHGENSNTSGRVYVPDSIDGQRIGSKRKLHEHWQGTVADSLPEGYKVSRKFWQLCITKEDIDLQRRKPGTDFCDDCMEFENKLRADPNNSALVAAFEEHIKVAKAEKDVYRHDFEHAQQQIAEMGGTAYRRILGDILIGVPQVWMSAAMELHIALDMGASWHYPRFSKQPKSLYMAQRADVFVSVAINMGSGHKLVMLWDETMGEKNANKTANALDYAIRRLCIGEQCLVLHIDNSGKENKNHTVFAFCQALVDGGVFKTVVMKYMVPGHTSFLPDLVLGNLRNYSDSQNFYSLKEVADVMRSTSKDVDVCVLHPSSQRDYTSWCGPWAVMTTNYAIHDSFIRADLRFAQFGYTQNGIMAWSTSSVPGSHLQQYPIMKPRGGSESQLELVPWSQDSIPEEKVNSLLKQRKFIPEGRLTMLGSDGSLDDADAVALRPLLLDPVVLQAGIDRREGRRRARQSREEHEWKQVVGAEPHGDTERYMVSWKGADWVNVFTCEEWNGPTDPGHSATDLELDGTMCNTDIVLKLDASSHVWTHGVVISFNARAKLHVVEVENGEQLQVSLVRAKPAWRLRTVCAATWACYMCPC